jgi:hypothetical protein
MIHIRVLADLRQESASVSAESLDSPEDTASCPHRLNISTRVLITRVTQAPSPSTSIAMGSTYHDLGRQYLSDNLLNTVLCYIGLPSVASSR